MLALWQFVTVKEILTSKARSSFILPYNFQYWDWKIQIYCDAIWHTYSWWCVPKTVWPVLWKDWTINCHRGWHCGGKQPNHKDHDVALTNLLESARNCNIRLNFDKLQYKKTEVKFFGETYTTDGHKPAQSKVSAIVEMPPLTCKKQLQSFIGMVNHLSKFSVRLSEFAELIRELSKEKVPFNWGPEHQAAFKQMKNEIARAPILAYYNPKKETILQTNASIKGLSACLFQDQKPAYFASKALTET